MEPKCQCCEVKEGDYKKNSLEKLESVIQYNLVQGANNNIAMSFLLCEDCAEKLRRVIEVTLFSPKGG